MAHLVDHQVGQRELGQLPVIAQGAEHEVVGDQRMHAIHRHEFLGERVGDAVVIGGRAGNALQYVVSGDPAETSFEAFAQQPEPVGAHREHRGRVGDDGRRPVDGVDLRDHGGGDQARGVVEPLIVHPGILRGEPVTYRVVFAQEQRMQQCQPDPEVACGPGEVDVRVDVGGWEAELVDAKLALLARS